MNGIRTIAKAVAAFLVVAGLGSGTCTVAVCSEPTCDPCFAQCKCSRVCRHGLGYDFETVHRLSTFRLAESVDPDGMRARVISEIVGLSLDLAQGPKEHSAEDYTRFARAVIDVNPRLLSPRGENWTAEPAQLFQTAILVPCRGGNTQGDLGLSLDFLFDRRGHLVEIHQVLGPDR